MDPKQSMSGVKTKKTPSQSARSKSEATRQKFSQNAGLSARDKVMEHALEQRVQSEAEAQTKTKPIQGVGFWILVMLAIIVDIVDLVSATTLSVFITPPFFLICALYFHINGVNISFKRTVSWIADSLPVSGALPLSTFGLFYVRRLENEEWF